MSHRPEGVEPPDPATATLHCRTCNTALDPRTTVCPTCGVPPWAGTSYCPVCSATTQPAAVMCVRCGVGLKPPAGRSKLVAGLLGIFLGGFGVHRFYLGFTTIGVVQIVVTLATCGVGALWGLIEGVLILTGNIDRDADGRPLDD